MRVVYLDKQTEQLCTVNRVAVQAFGRQGARNLQRRVGELRSAADSRAMFEGPGRWHPLHGDMKGSFAADVTGSVRMIVRFEGEPVVAVVLTVGNVYH